MPWSGTEQPATKARAATNGTRPLLVVANGALVAMAYVAMDTAHHPRYSAPVRESGSLHPAPTGSMARPKSGISSVSGIYALVRVMLRQSDGREGLPREVKPVERQQPVPAEFWLPGSPDEVRSGALTISDVGRVTAHVTGGWVSAADGAVGGPAAQTQYQFERSWRDVVLGKTIGGKSEILQPDRRFGTGPG